MRIRHTVVLLIAVAGMAAVAVPALASGAAHPVHPAHPAHPSGGSRPDRRQACRPRPRRTAATARVRAKPTWRARRARRLDVRDRHGQGRHGYGSQSAPGLPQREQGPRRSHQGNSVQPMRVGAERLLKDERPARRPDALPQRSCGRKLADDRMWEVLVAERPTTSDVTRPPAGRVAGAGLHRWAGTSARQPRSPDRENDPGARRRPAPRTPGPNVRPKTDQ